MRHQTNNPKRLEQFHDHRKQRPNPRSRNRKRPMRFARANTERLHSESRNDANKLWRSRVPFLFAVFLQALALRVPP